MIRHLVCRKGVHFDDLFLLLLSPPMSSKSGNESPQPIYLFVCLSVFYFILYFFRY